MLIARLRTISVFAATALLSTGCGNAAPVDSLAVRAVAAAKSMPAGRERDVTLREVSRNLRHADRDQAIEAASGMSEDYELRTFGPGPDKLTRQIVAQQDEQRSEDRACERFVERLRPGGASAADDRRIRDCFSMDAPPGIVPPPIPPFRLILLAADALPAWPTKASLLYMATWDSVPDRPAGGAAEAVRRLRALIPLLAGETRREAMTWLDTTSVDLIEGRPDDAVDRIRRSFARRQATGDAPLPEPGQQAQGLIADFLHARDLDRALTVTNLLSPSDDCAAVDDGLTGVLEWVLPSQDSTVVAAYMTRLTTSGILARLCPKGLSSEIAAEAWLNAGNDDKALEAASRLGDPLVLGKTRLAVIQRRMTTGDASGAGSLLRMMADAPPPLDRGDPFEQVRAARQRIQLIHLLTKAGNIEDAERLASAYAGPGWRAFAWSVIVGTKGRDRAGPNWAGPSLDLQDVPADH